MAVRSGMSIVSIKEKGHFEHENSRIDKYTLADELPTKLSELGLRPRKITTAPAPPTYTIRTVTQRDREIVLDFLRRFFFRDEPMNLAVGLLETPDSRCLELEDYVCSSLSDNVSVAAVDNNGDIVGIIINGISRKEDTKKGDDKSAECSNPKFQRILRVLEHLDTQARIWEKVSKDCDTVVEIRIASTHSDWRGRGLMKILCDETEHLARKIGAGALRMDTTSQYSAAAAERSRYRKVYSTLYADMPFAPQPAAPHLEASVYIKDL